MQRECVRYNSREGKVDYVCVCTCLCLYCISSACYVRYNYNESLSNCTFIYMNGYWLSYGEVLVRSSLVKGIAVQNWRQP
jgi:hypothetical protein